MKLVLLFINDFFHVTWWQIIDLKLKILHLNWLFRTFHSMLFTKFKIN